jgi:hypothetical protein
MLLKVLLVYLLIGFVYSTYRLKNEYRHSYFMLTYSNVKYPAGSMLFRWIGNVIGWLPKMVMEVLNA